MKYDVAVIGGGPAGYVAAIKAAQLGGNVVLFEKDTLGGTCLNRGCIPTKSYLKTSEELEVIRNAATRGIICDPAASIDMPKVVAYKNKVVKRLTDGVGMLLKSHAIHAVYGNAAMVSPTSIDCGGQIYEAVSTILCGGAKPFQLPIPGIESKNVLTSDELLQLEQVPPRLAIIGGGVIGCEMAAAFHGFGSKVTIIEAMDRLIPTMDEELSASMLSRFTKAKISVALSQRAKSISDEADGSSTVHLESGQSVCADKILVSIGRVADTACLGALREKVRLDRGTIVVDDHMRTSIPNLYAAGDINGRLMLAHAAFKMGETAALNALGHDAQCKLDTVPSCVYTTPEAAGVGITEAEAKRRFGQDHIAVGRFPFSGNGRSLASGSTDGFVKVVTEKRYGEILGVHIFGCNAAEMITEAAVLMSCEIPAAEAADIIHPHPSFSEALMEACADASGRCIHLPKRS